jgi:hypothetical protein
MADAAAVATFVLAVATSFVAGFTAWLAWETRKTRLQEREEHERLAFRAALVEQLENCRDWLSHSPERSYQAVARLHDRAPRFDAVTGLIGAVDLSGDLVDYLIWQLAEIRDEHDRLQELLSGINPELAVAGQVQLGEVRDLWRLLVDRLQVLACLVRSEAHRRGIRVYEVGTREVRWLRPLPGPPQGRSLTEANDRATLAAPPWPTGFDTCGPAERDAQAEAVAQEKQDQLRSSVGP